MIEYRYEAVDAAGHPIHGTSIVGSESVLREQLKARGLRVVSATVMSAEELNATNRLSMPRLHQLRVGEQLREAMLTGLPVHEAVRAIAVEPLSHPLTGIVPWIQVITGTVCAAASICWWQLGTLKAVAISAGAVTFLILPLLQMLLYRIYCSRPKATLLALANRLEAGEDLTASIKNAVPSELKYVMSAQISADSKARVAADLMPVLLGSNLRVQQFAMTLLGPLCMMAIVASGLYSVLLFVVPMFKKIFIDFGTELPGMTMLVVSLSDLVASLGMTGWLVLLTACIVGLALMATGLLSGKLGELLESVPVFGIAFRWAMQAKVARVLGAMVRNNVPYAQALRTATQASGFRSVEHTGAILANELETRSGVMLPHRKLSGLPISMLFSADSSSDAEQRRIDIAATFQSLSEMLETATISQGRLLAVCVQSLNLLVSGTLIVLGVLALFLPLIKLLNDLA